VSLRPPEALGSVHDVGGFDCGVEALNRWLRRASGVTGLSATFVIANHGRVAGFYTLSAATVRSEAAPVRLRRGAPEPVLKLGRLAVDGGSQGRGLGMALLMDAFARTYAVSRHTHIAALVADAPDASARWLERAGFLRVPGDATTMFVALGAIEALVERPMR